MPFTQPVDAASAASTKSYRLERWRYRYQPDYGSKKYGRSAVEVQRAKVGGDGRSVEIILEPAMGKGLVAGWMIQITCEVTSVTGDGLTTKTAWYPLNRLQK